MLRVAVELLHALRLELLEIAERLIFPAAEVYFAQARIGLQREVLGDIDARGGFTGAVEVAGVAGVDRDGGKAPFQRRNLT